MENLIKGIFNIDSSQIRKINTVYENGTSIVYLRLNKPNYDLLCPVCRKKLIGNGIKIKPINHKVFTDRNMKLIYEANRFRCKDCGHSTLEKNPFAIKGFNNSILVVNQVMIDLHDYRYNYTMIGEKK